LPRVIPGWRWEPAVEALLSLRGMALLTAATLVAELTNRRHVSVVNFGSPVRTWCGTT